MNSWIFQGREQRYAVFRLKEAFRPNIPAFVKAAKVYEDGLKRLTLFAQRNKNHGMEKDLAGLQAERLRLEVAGWRDAVARTLTSHPPSPSS